MKQTTFQKWPGIIHNSVLPINMNKNKPKWNFIYSELYHIH